MHAEDLIHAFEGKDTSWEAHIRALGFDDLNSLEPLTTVTIAPAHRFHSDRSPSPKSLCTVTPTPFTYPRKLVEPPKVDHFFCKHCSPSPFELPHKAPYIPTSTSPKPMSCNDEQGYSYFESDTNADRHGSLYSPDTGFSNFPTRHHKYNPPIMLFGPC